MTSSIVTISNNILLLTLFFFMLALTGAPNLLNDNVCMFEWQLSNLSIDNYTISLIFDPLSLSMSSTVLLITISVIMFSNTYIQAETNPIRFTYTIIIFVASIIIFVHSPNLTTLFIGWDGLGIISFLLVIYYGNTNSLVAGIITVLTNRLGDSALLIGAAAISSQHWVITNQWGFGSIAFFLLLVTSITNSAQLPFTAWLPAAIAAPTPISALVHSSTLVTAGVYIIIRLLPTVNHFHCILNALLCLGAATITYASFIAIYESDIKKIVALSTLSQLGLIFYTLGLGAPAFTIFHLQTHALFNALLFISVGILIHINSHTQDLRLTGPQSSPLVEANLIISNMALIGVPFLAGFYSNDLLLETSIISNLPGIGLLLGVISVIITAAYTSRLLINHMTLCEATTNGCEAPIDTHIHFLVIPTCAITAGSVINWISVGPTQPIILSIPENISTLLLLVLGTTIGTLILNTNEEESTINPISQMLYFGPMAKSLTLIPINNINEITNTLDIGWHESLGAAGLASTLRIKSNLLNTNTSTQFHLILGGTILILYTS